MPFVEHEIIDTPPDELLIYKYMGFDKFVSLLFKRELFFCRSNKFEDTREGTFSDGIYASSVEDLATIYRNSGSNDQDAAIYAKMFHQMVRSLYSHRHTNLISSFCSNTHEYDSLWKLYSNVFSGVCIISDIGRLKESLKSVEQNIFIGKVRYLNYAHDLIDTYNALAPYFHKKREYEVEKEVRALWWDSSGTVDSKLIGSGLPIDLNKFISSVVVGPKSSPEHLVLIKSILKDLGLGQVVVSKSKIYDVPNI